jgi:murein hydrolase activator
MGLNFDTCVFGMIFRKVMITAFVAAGILMGSQAVMGADVGTILVAGLNLRSGPGEDFQVVAQLAQGVQVQILGREKGWLKIAFQDQQGFIKHKPRYIEIVQAAEPADEDAEIIRGRLTKAQSEVAAISRKEKAVIDAFNSAEEALSKARSQVHGAKAGLQAIEVKIDEIDTASAALKEEIRSSEAYAANRLAAMYKLNWVGRIQLLATSGSFFDFIQRKSALGRILEQDADLLEKLHRDQAALESLLTELNTRMAEKRTLQTTLNGRIKKLSAQQKKRGLLLQRIRSEKSLGLAALEDLKQASLELDNTMQSLAPAKRPAAAATPDLEAKPFAEHKGLLSWPVKGKIISVFGPYRDEQFKVMNFQSGINIKAERGEPIRAISDGLTIFASWFKGFGNMMIVDHGDHYYTVYAHLEEVFKVKGDRVEKDEVIATVGDSGSMMGPALHFEVRHHGKPMDPLKWIRKG